MKFNFRGILNILSTLLVLNGCFMALCLPFTFIYNESWLPILAATLLCLAMGIMGRMLTYSREKINLKGRDGYLIVTLGWLAMTTSGSLVYILSGAIPEYSSAFFETMSGYTTTGASILTDIESLPKSILLWRSMTQWIGGMGIIVLAVAILPLLGIGGMQLFVAESPGLTADKVKPRIQDTAKRLWVIYLSLTLIEFIVLSIGGMPVFDALNHALTTMATGGFSTKNASIAHFDSRFIEYTIVIFMFLAGTNFTLIYFFVKGQFRRIWKNEEFRVYVFAIVGLVFAIAFALTLSQGTAFETHFRQSLFQVVSILTTTGYVTADFTAWVPFVSVIFFSIMFVGGSSGSTSGGVKIVRHMVLFKNSFLQMKRQLHPSAIIPVRVNNNAIKQETVFNVLAFIMIYLTMFVIGSVLLSWTGLDFVTALGAAATCIGNIGPGLGGVGPVENFAVVSDPGKWVLSFLMLIGRLELFTVLLLITPAFWRD